MAQPIRRCCRHRRRRGGTGGGGSAGGRVGKGERVKAEGHADRAQVEAWVAAGGQGGEGGGVCRPRETGGSNVAQMSPIGSNEPVSTVHTKFRQRWRFAADTCAAARNGLPFRFNQGPAWTAPPVRRCTAVLALPVAHTVLHSYAHPPHSPCQAPRAQPAVLVGSCAAPGRVREREPATSQLSLVWLPTTANID